MCVGRFLRVVLSVHRRVDFLLMDTPTVANGLPTSVPTCDGQVTDGGDDALPMTWGICARLECLANVS